MLVRIFYFGCGYHELGHCWWRPEPSQPRARRAVPEHERLPHLDGRFAPCVQAHDHSRAEAPQGIFRTVFVSQPEVLASVEWTVVAWWDRSGDDRPQSNSALALSGVKHFADVIAEGKRAFAWVFDRMPYHLVPEPL